MKNKNSTFYPLVTCIVPVYNADKYLDQGVTSLLQQTYKNVEIILVDDQSTDNSWKKCLAYSENHTNIKAFQNIKNSGGPFRGRERGILEASGEWITFMDCDDYVMPSYIENLVIGTNGGKYDIATTGYSRLYEDERIEDFLWNDYSQTTADRVGSFYQHFLNNDFWTDPTDTIGQSLVRASICKSIDLSVYSDRVYAEDTLMALLFITHSESGVNFIDKHDFVWRQLKGSGSHGGFSDTANKEEFFKACLAILHDTKNYQFISRSLPLVTVIVPVYNVEMYLGDCLESIIKQTYSNLEIIIVNDGSSDNSQIVIESYKKKDKRIVSIEQVNKGLNMARAAGSSMLTGEYVTFVDSDDMIHVDYVKALYETLVMNNVDISACGFSNVFEGSVDALTNNYDINHRERVIKQRKDVIGYLLLQSPATQNVHQMTAWSKMYKADLIKSTDWNFSNYRRHEDNLESLQWHSMADNGIAIISTRLYLYRNNPNSITQTSQKNINPEGKELTYFEYLYELYLKTDKYLADNSMNLMVLNYFAHLNRLQLLNYFTSSKLTDEDMKYAIENQRKIVILFNNIVNAKQSIVQEQSKRVSEMVSSGSWKITEPLRKTKNVLKKIHKKINRN